MIKGLSYKTIFLWLIPMGISFYTHAQKGRILSGTIVDQNSKEPLPYATVFLKKQGIGTLTNEEGRFSILLLYEEPEDSLLAVSLGYKDYSEKIDGDKSSYLIRMEASVSQLTEVVVRPLPPTWYINRAMRAVQEIRPMEAYQTEGYYLEKIAENKKFLKYDEGIFRSYIHKYKDTLRRQYQLILYRQAAPVIDMKFMQEERKKLEEKDAKKNKGKNSEVKRGIDHVFLSGGPAIMLHYASISKRADDFLDSLEFKNFDYTFAQNSGYADGDMMVIDFKSKGVVDHVIKSGKIYIHIPTNAILKIEGAGEFVIPTLMRPLMFLYGFSAQELTFQGRKEYQMINGRWYFKTAAITAKIGVTKKRWFTANEHADFEGTQSYTVLKIKEQQVQQIAREKRYNPDKRMDGQVQSEPGRSWAEFEGIIGK